MIYLSFRGIERKNALFHILSPERKRVKIAQDVIHQLDAERLRAKTGNYVCETLTLRDIQNTAQTAGDVQRMLVKKDPDCTTCALGAIFLSAIRLGNNYHGDIINGASESTVTRPLIGYFEQEQLALIETAFEGVNYIRRGKLQYHELDSARDFRNNYDDPNERLYAIMWNIVRNNGRFIPD